MKRLFILLLMAPWLCLVDTARAAESIGLVIGVQGDAKAVAVNGSERALSLKSPVYLKDTLRTGAGSKLQIMFNDDSLFSQGENSEIVVDEYVYDPARKDDNSFMLKVIRGISRIITGKITDLNPDRFTVKTRRATIGIRGCELGFSVETNYDQVYVVRIPQGKRIVIGDVTPGQAGLDITAPGWIRIWGDGRILQGTLTPDDIQMLSGTTTPAVDPSRRKSGGTESRIEPDDGSEEALLDDQQPDVFTDTEILPTVEDLKNAVVPDADQTSESLSPIPPRVATKPPPGPLPIAGGGLGATYAYLVPDSQMQRLFVYDRVLGTIEPGRTSVDLSGGAFDRSGNFLGPVSLSLKDIPLAVFGGQTAYEGFVQRAISPSVNVANDNLQQFVRYIDYNNPTLRLAYWGNPASAFPKSALPPGMVTTYAVDMAGYPEQLPGPYTPANDIKTGDLLVNTKTGNYCIRAIGGLTQYGRLSDLTFFGQQSQGVGMIRNESAVASGSAPEGREVAGFRVLGSDQPAETGGWSYNGYAAGYRTPLTFVGPSLCLMSANALSDSVGGNEGRVTIALNKDAYLNNVNLNIGLFQDPASPMPYDVTLGQPDFGAYVQGNEFVAAYGNPVNRIEVRNSGVGNNWTWGEWNGERTVDTGGGVMGNESVHGNFVAGRTLTAIEFQTLVAGASSYSLQTPVANPGVAFASITRGNYFSQISGTANLSVNIPGGGASATWGGNFSLAGGADDLTIVVSPGSIITPAGHLQGVSSSYILHAGGMTAGALASEELTGNLVGPGTGPRPITGAVGSGRFTHVDGTDVVLTYGTDLAPP
jgi:hypothetical protein